MIHKYKFKNKNIVMDINSGALHIVDDIAYRVLAEIEANPDITEDELIIDGYSSYEVLESFMEIKELIQNKLLFSEDIFKHTQPHKESVVKALCLHIAHDCNLKCKYCFAGEGEYHGKRSLMDAETGKRALDFLVMASGKRRNLEVDFFGGEPTINFEVVKQIVDYGRNLEKIHNKKIRFTLTTNAFAINDDTIVYSNKNMSNVVLSIDGRMEVNDKMRPDRAGRGSYDRIVPNIIKFIEKREGKDYYARGTFTKHNLDFSEDVIHLYKLGIKQISIEPVVAPEDKDYAITEQDVPAIFSEYDRLTEILLKYRDLSFFHFNIDLTGGSCALKRISGCGAGCEYMSVTPDGCLYPCHQFAGLDEFRIGNVFDGIQNEALVNEFGSLNVYKKEHCSDCWAKFYCGGGCAANAYQHGGSVSSAYEIGCQLQKKRIECAVYLAAMKSVEFS